METHTLPHAKKVTRRRNPWKVLGLVLLLVSSAVALWFINEGGLAALQPVTLRAALPGDFAPEVSMGDWTDPSPRPLVVVSGPFTKRTRIESYLYLVRNGTIVENNVARAYRSPHDRGGSRWVSRTVILCMAKADRPDGKVSWLTARGGGAGGGGGSEYVHTIESKDWETFPGTLEAGRAYLAYIEGDRTIKADRTMSVTDFARRNRGNYLVVEVILIEKPRGR